MYSYIETSSPPACETTIIHQDRVLAVNAAMPADHVIARMASIFQALADPTRVRLLCALLEHEMCVCDLTALLKVSQSAVSHQLRLLRSLGLVAYRKEGRVVYYALDDDHIRELLACSLEHVAHKTIPDERGV